MVNQTENVKTNKKVKKVLLLYPGKSVTAYWLDGKYPLQYLEKQQKINFIEKTPRQIVKEDLREIDLIYCIRCVDLLTRQVIALAKERSIPFVYFTDDNFFIVSEPCTQRQQKQVAMAIDQLTQVAAVVVVSPELATIVQQYNQNVTFIIPYQIFLEEIRPKDDSGQIIIGHMSTLYREAHLQFVIPAIKRILAEYSGKVSFEFIGYNPKELGEYRQVTHFSFLEDYLEFRRFFATRQWNIGIAPLQDDSFSRSKTDNKFREFGAAKICGIYSNVKCYSDWVQHKVTGYIAENTEEAWYQAMQQLIEDPQLRAAIADNACRYVKEHYDIERYCSQLLNVFERLW